MNQAPGQGALLKIFTLLGVLFAAGVLIILFSGMVSGLFDGKPRASLFGSEPVAIVRIDDMIVSSEETVDQLNQLKEDDGIRAVVLRINSPGGGVAASQEIFDAVGEVRGSGKKVVASLGGLAASGAYYIACAADTIVANPGTVTGSIGVIFEFPMVKQLLQKVGVEMTVVKSGKYKDAGSPFRALTEEERGVFQDLIDDAWLQFMEAVSERRAIPLEKLRPLAAGQVFTGKQAAAFGLVDVMGNFETAKQLAKTMAKLPSDAKIFEFNKKKPILERILGTSPIGKVFGLNASAAGLSYLFLQ